MSKLDLSSAIERDLAQALALSRINHSLNRIKMQDSIYFFYPHDFGKVFEALDWDTDCCIEVEIRLSPRAELREEQKC